MVVLGNDIVLEFTNDSPMFRKQVEGLDDSIEDLDAYVKSILTHTKQYLSAGKRFAQVGRELANCLNEKNHARALFTSTYEKLGDLSNILENFHTYLHQIQDLQDDLLKTLQAEWFVPLLSFSTEIQKSKAVRRSFKQSSQDFETLLHKSLQDRSKTYPDAAETQYQLDRFDLVQHYNAIEAKKKQIVLQSFDSTIKAHRKHYFAGLELTDALEKRLSEQTQACETASAAFVEETRIWEQERVKLAAGIEPVEILCSRAVKDAHGMQGYLFVRKSSSKALPVSSKRQWFQLHAGKLFHVQKKELNPILICDLKLSMVKETTEKGKYSFQVIDNSQAKYIFQAETKALQYQWIDAVRESIETMLTDTKPADIEPKVQALMLAHPECADCSVRPADWISINLGVLLCIECSGIHRSLGVEVSQIRSLTLDAVPDELLDCVSKFLGNERVNSIFEAILPPGWIKPTSDTKRQLKEKWIKAKYVFRGFTNPEQVDDIEDRLFQAAQDGSVAEILFCLAHGADLSMIRNGESVLHRCAAFGHTECCGFLIRNGASVVAVDSHGQLPFEVAKAAGFEHLKLFLMQKRSLEEYHK